MKASKIILYDEPGVPELQTDRLEEFLRDMLRTKVEVRGSFFEGREGGFFERIAGTRIHDLKRPFSGHSPTAGEIAAARGGSDVEGDTAALYDGFEFQRAIAGDAPADDALHVVFTSKLTCTFDEDDCRYHARAVICSNPAIISTAGIIEAPAKPRQYYLDLMAGLSQDQARDRHRGEFLEYHDPRLSEVAEGYLLQAVIYHETGEAFCDSRECRLFNAHWQKDLLYLQVQNKGLCQRHLQVLERIRHG